MYKPRCIECSRLIAKYDKVVPVSEVDHIDRSGYVEFRPIGLIHLSCIRNQAEGEGGK